MKINLNAVREFRRVWSRIEEEEDGPTVRGEDGGLYVMPLLDGIGGMQYRRIFREWFDGAYLRDDDVEGFIRLRGMESWDPPQ